MHFYNAVHQPRRPLVTMAHPTVGRRSRCHIKAQAGASSQDPGLTDLLSGMPLNLDETTLPLQNPTLRQCVASAATARPRAVDSSLAPRNPSQDVAPATSGSVGSGGKQEGWRRAGGRQPPLAAPASRKMWGLFSGKCSSAPRAKDNSGSKLLPPTVMEK